jgi:hypothetical protein
LAASWRLTERAGSRVKKEGFEDLESAIGSLEDRGRELAAGAHAEPAGGTLMRRLEPGQIVVARLELRGPRVSAGLDVRGDGSAEAFTGRLRRRLIEQRAGESPYDALRRELLEAAPRG